mmetsp:Transcript_4021/g.8142  ORF Transcript_4021/g.8142 Transcript_4021/m.8142 type:complete len:175 (-) Transcript_4021:96-620(-)
MPYFHLVQARLLTLALTLRCCACFNCSERWQSTWVCSIGPCQHCKPCYTAEFDGHSCGFSTTPTCQHCQTDCSKCFAPSSPPATAELTTDGPMSFTEFLKLWQMVLSVFLAVSSCCMAGYLLLKAARQCGRPSGGDQQRRQIDGGTGVGVSAKGHRGQDAACWDKTASGTSSVV